MQEGHYFEGLIGSTQVQEDMRHQTGELQEELDFDRLGDMETHSTYTTWRLLPVASAETDDEPSNGPVVAPGIIYPESTPIACK